MKVEKSDINDLINDNQKLRELLQSIVTDVDAMCGNSDITDTGDLGPFEEWWGNDDNEVYISWPNVSILIEQAKEYLKKETKWTTKKKSETGGRQPKS